MRLATVTNLWFSEYFPQNIMHDKRVQRGNTYAAMVIPAGAYPDTMQGASSLQEAARSQTKKSTIRSTMKKVRA